MSDQLMALLAPFLSGPPPGSTDTVPAWLTPGEAVIPREAAQNPKNKKVIRKLVQEGREKKIPSEETMAQMPHEELWRLRHANAGNKEAQMQIAPFEHRAFAREFSQERPVLGPLSLAVATPLYQAKKALGLESQDDMSTGFTPESAMKQMKQGYLGIWDGLQAQGHEYGLTGDETWADLSPEHQEAILRAQRYVESPKGFYNEDGSVVTSPTGALGSAGIIPSTGRKPGYNTKPWDGTPKDALRFQRDYLTNLSTRRKGLTVSDALVSYHDGPGNQDVGKQPDQYPDPLYVKKIQTAMKNKPWLVDDKDPENLYGYEPLSSKPKEVKMVWVEPTYKTIVDEEAYQAQKAAEQKGPSIAQRGMPAAAFNTAFMSMDMQTPAAREQAAKKPFTRQVVDRPGYYAPLVPADPDFIPEMPEEAQQKLNPVPQQGGQEPRMLPARYPGEVPLPTKREAIPSLKEENIQVNPMYEGVGKTTPGETQFISAMEDPELQRQLQAFQDEAKAITEKTGEPPPKNWMEGVISSIFGEKGLFRPEDLARFAVMAAGGLLTGGSVNGSLRYAARDTMALADKRSSQEYAQEVAQKNRDNLRLQALSEKEKALRLAAANADRTAKNNQLNYERNKKDIYDQQAFVNLTNRIEQMDNQYLTFKGTGVKFSPEVEAIYEKSKTFEDMGQQEAYLRAALLQARREVAEAGVVAAQAKEAQEGRKDFLNSLKTYGPDQGQWKVWGLEQNGFKPGESLIVHQDGYGKHYVQRGGTWRELPPDWEKSAMPISQVEKAAKKIEDDTTESINTALNGNKQIQNLLSDRKIEKKDLQTLAGTLSRLAAKSYNDYGKNGYMNPVEYGNVVTAAMKGIIDWRMKDDGDTNVLALLTPGEFQKIFEAYAMTSVKAPPAALRLLSNDPKDPKTISPDAMEVLSNATKARMETLQKNRPENMPKITAAQAMDDLYKTFLAFRNSYGPDAMDNTEKNVFAPQKTGFNAFTYWLQHNRTFPTP